MGVYSNGGLDFSVLPKQMFDIFCVFFDFEPGFGRLGTFYFTGFAPMPPAPYGLEKRIGADMY